MKTIYKLVLDDRRMNMQELADSFYLGCECDNHQKGEMCNSLYYESLSDEINKK